ncbi:MAG: nitronate monooxygenase [Chloroflexi bacterium]|nr:nitronate monooxygenase [Chloroflexota bacterium]
MRTRMTELFGIEHPIMCGGMMWLAKPELCAAISNAGALGNLTAQNYMGGEEFRKAVQQTRKLTDKPFCVNITALPAIRITKEMHWEYFQVCCQEQVRAIEVSGTPLDKYFGPQCIEMAKKAGVKLIHKVGAVRHALHAERAGYDAVIAAGIEEGGHPLDDDVTTMLLTPRMRESVNIPVITTGGIADGRSLAAALVLGADGVMMASRFVATTECKVHQNVKEEIARKQEHETTLINKSIHLQMRTWKNEAAKKVLEIEERKGTLDEILAIIAGDRASRLLEQGDVESAPFAVGQSVGLIHDVVSCKEVVERMVKEAEETLASTLKRIKS